MSNYFKNFFVKLLLLPIIALLGLAFMLLFLLAPQFKLFKDEAKHWRSKKRGNYGNQKEKDKEFEAFY